MMPTMMPGLAPTVAAAGRTIMPGGGIARRPLHVIIMADCSGSMMHGGKIQALNFAIAEMLQQFAEWERTQASCQVLIRAIAFSATPEWHVPEPLPVGHVRWTPLQAVPKGRTNMAPAFRLAASVLTSDKLERRAFNPVLLLITDGMPTDPDDIDGALAELMSLRAGRDAMRLAVAIGQDAKSGTLTRFIADPAVPVLLASNVSDIADQLKLATLMVTRPGYAADLDESEPADETDVVV
jgi:Mg-chelatase subunit ChlD